MANSENVVNQLLGAIDTVIGKRLEQLSYDKTIICTIIDDSKAKNGEYQVSDGSVKFWAKCENANYRNDEQVRVSVPNGDTTQEKFIIGKYVKDSSNTPITYMTPLGSVLKMSGDICNTGNSDIYGLQATGPVSGVPTKTGTLLWTADIDADSAAMASSQIYDVIYIQADFKTILSNYSITSGTYGLMLSLGTTLANGAPGPAVTCLFDSTQMMGNPYAFGIYTTQAAKFDITNVGKLSSIQLLFYQDGNFTHNTNSLTPTNIPVVDGVNNILIKNIKIGFGADVTNVADETVKLFTTDDLRYDNDSTTSAITNEKHLKLAWYNKDENGQYIGFDDGKDENGNIKWIDEDAYLVAAGNNAKLQAQQNYDIPMDETGLELAAETRTIRDTLLNVSKSLSTDLHGLMSTLISRCESIASAKTYLESIDQYICKQEMSINQKNTLKAAANDCFDWYMNALNQAAAIHNKDILPTQISGSWTFKGDGTNPGAEPGYYNAFTTFFTSVKSKFFDSNDVFLPTLYTLVTGNYTGYKGIYDDAERKIATLLNDLESKWTSALTSLNGNAALIAQYFVAGHTINAWQETDTSAYDSGYAVYWYRYNPNANGDNFAERGWERIVSANNNIEGITITCDAVNMEKEEFKVIVIYNHEKYESNVLTFTNQSPVINAATAILSDGITIHHGENSLESYQSYNIANTLVNGADRYTKRELSIEFAHNDGVVDNQALVNAQIYWYIPTNATMLDYDLTDLKSLNISNDFVNDITSLSHSEMYKEGYVCFYKTIGYGLTTDNIADYTKDLKFCYRIKNYYTPTAAQNTIYCTVVKNDIKYHGEILMTFSSYGTSGTDYTLVVSPATKQAAITPSNFGENAWTLNIDLYDNTNNIVNDISTIKVRLKQGNDRYKLVGSGLANAEGYYTAYYANNQWHCFIEFDAEGTSIPCGILEAVAEGVQHGESKVNLTTFFPIPYSANVDYYIEGASVVVYDSQGGNPSYFKQPYKLFQQIPPSGTGAGGEVTGGSWDIAYTNSPPDGVKAYLPTLSKRALLPANMWIDGGDISYDAEKNATSHIPYVFCKVGEDVVWSQPILIIQNRYPSPMLNAWDGKFTIDDKNGTILSTMVSAGRKNQDNQFEGVLMGDIEAGAKFNPDNKSGLGIYGFNAGAQAFGFNIDGTAFLGKSGKGRILFDGNSGSISSASYNDPAVREPIEDADGNIIGYRSTTAGMMIDLDDGFIDMLGGTKSVNEETGKVSYGTERTESGAQSRVKISVQSPYFFIESKQGNRLLNIGDETAFSPNVSDKDKGYYFKTDNYVATTWTTDNVAWTSGAGMLIDLAQGKIDAYDFTLRGEDPDSRSYLKLSSNPTQMMKVFYVNKEIENDPGLTVLEVGTSAYTMRSFNWWNVEDSDKVLTGMEIDVENGRITAYSSVDEQPGYKISIDASDETGNIPLMIGLQSSPSFQVSWDGSLSINNDKFNVDSFGNLWINGDTLSDAIFSVTNEGLVTMKRGSINLGDGAFYVDDDGNLAIGNTSFTVNALGEMTATSGTIGGWKISGTSLKSSNDMMELGSTGTIKIGTYSVDSSSGNAFEVTSAGIMKAANYELASGKINTALLMKGKMRVVKSNNSSISVATVAGQDPQLWVDGDTYLNGRILISPSASLETGDSTAQEMDADLRTTMKFTSLGSKDANGVWQYKYNGLYIFGASTCLYTGNIWIGRNDTEGGSEGTGVTNTYMNGNIRVNANNDKGLIYFPDPSRIVVRGDTYTLAQYITEAAAGQITGIEVTASTSLFATNACYLVKTDKTTKYDSEGKPVHFSNGVPVACSDTFATQTWVTNKNYATQTWVENKGYLTFIPSEYITETELNDKGYLTSIPSEYITETELNNKNYITSSALPDMELYVLKTTYDEKIAELEAKIAALTPST